MADYWKSTEKKYCDFCKCWIGHDKMTISLHENGRKHKDNVTKKISAMHKRSSQEYKESVKMDKEMRKMEEAGLKAYMKDIESNSDLMSHTINDTLANTNSILVLGSSIETEKTTYTKPVERKPPNKKKNNPNSSKKGNKGKKETIPDVSLWYEAKASDDSTYYWHIKTNESVWETPAEGYMPLAEQETLLEKQKNDLEKLEENKKLIEKEIIAEQRAQDEREKLKKFKVEQEPEAAYRYGPSNRRDPYGKWTSVETSKRSLDLQLPYQEYVAVKVPLLIPSQKPTKEFKEKLFTSLAEDSDDDNSDKNIGFKKRKICGSNRKNTRKRADDD